ncbi:haloacid dehalogenase [Obba rivulosa]|uniref:Haloacid dehalogenase n=1 Tax=Obba rivulosa TaxID=1052685 RepID=A0A8E2AM50_9APHY|nr:haloacid dehalogenase [Obba rivulosa]
MHTLAFDIYGTLLDTSSIASAVAENTGCSSETASQLSQLWRRYQLEYTWRLNSMGRYEPFDSVTRRSLLHAAKETGLEISDKTANTLMEAYSRLPPFEDTVSALEALKELSEIKFLVFSNGTNEMVTSALVAALPARLLPVPKYLVESIQQYKPAREVYHGLLKSLGEPIIAPTGGPRVWLVSGNPFDVTGARAAGLGAIWVDRAGKGWMDQLVDRELGPSKIVRSLSELVGVVKELQ